MTWLHTYTYLLCHLLNTQKMRNSTLPYPVKMEYGWNFWLELSFIICILGCPRLWRITKNSLHNEGIYKWVNLAPMFFWHELLPTTSGPQKFAKISVFKVDNFVLSIFLVPKLRSVAQIEWKKHPYLFFLLLVQK